MLVLLLFKHQVISKVTRVGGRCCSLSSCYFPRAQFEYTRIADILRRLFISVTAYARPTSYGVGCWTWIIKKKKKELSTSIVPHN